MRSNDKRCALQLQDLPANDDPFFDRWYAVSRPGSYEWHSQWGRALRRKLRALGWRPIRLEAQLVTWQ